MGFMGMVFGTAFLIAFVVHCATTIVFTIVTIILKAVGKGKDNKKLKTAGNVFLVLTILFWIPVIVIIGIMVFNNIFFKVELPDGKSKFIATKDISKMKEYVNNPSESSFEKLDKLLDKNSILVFYHDANLNSILDEGLKTGNPELVKISVEHGAIFDNPARYDHLSYKSSSMEDLNGYCLNRSITEDDVEILKFMFDKNASTEIMGDCEYASNILGRAVWTVLYNDDKVTNTELEYIQVYIDNGFDSDPALLLMDEVPSNYSYSFEDNCARDKNFEKLMRIINKM